jgi:hypothetical protein
MHSFVESRKVRIRSTLGKTKLKSFTRISAAKFISKPQSAASSSTLAYLDVDERGKHTLGHFNAMTAIVGPPTYPAPMQQILTSKSCSLMIFLVFYSKIFLVETKLIVIGCPTRFIGRSIFFYDQITIGKVAADENRFPRLSGVKMPC